MCKYGHMRVRALLAAEELEPAFRGAPLVCQISSLGLLHDSWLQEFQDSFYAERRDACALFIL